MITYPLTFFAFKGIVQRDVRGVESRLKRSALMNYLVGRLDIPTGRQTYRAVTVKLILLLSNDQKTKNVIKFYQDFLF
jgi:hypothetical protein